MKHSYVAIAAAMSLMIAGCSSGGYQQAIEIETVKIIDVQRYQTEGSAGPGAAVGLAAGIISGRGHSTESKVIRGLGGALVGGAVSKSLTSGHVEARLILQNRQGQRYVLPKQSLDLRPGDCMTMHTNRYGGTRVYRTSPTECNF